MSELPKHHPENSDKDFEVSSVGMLNVPTEEDKQLLIDLLENKCSEMENVPHYTEEDEYWTEFTLYQELLAQLKTLD